MQFKFESEQIEGLPTLCYSHKSPDIDTMVSELNYLYDLLETYIDEDESNLLSITISKHGSNHQEEDTFGYYEYRKIDNFIFKNLSLDE